MSRIKPYLWLCSYCDSSLFYFQLKDFILDQPDAYEVKIGDNVYRRSGDPPIEEVIEMLQKEKDDKSPAPREHEKDEL